MVAPKTQNETNGIPTSKPTPKPTEKPKPVLDLSKKPPTSPGRQSQRSPRSPARLIHEKHDVRVTSQQTTKTPSQSDENDSLPTDCPSPLREKCENLRKIAELQTGLSSKQFFTPAVNQMLLEIEELSQSISQKIRSNIYSYLVKVLFQSKIFLRAPDTGRSLKCPKKHVRDLFFLKCHEIEHIHFRSFFRFKIDHVLFSRNAPLFYVRKSCQFQNQFREKKHVIDFETEKGPKMNVFDFVAFQ